MRLPERLLTVFHVLQAELENAGDMCIKIVEDLPPIPPHLHNVQLAQHAQVVRDRRFRQAYRFHYGPDVRLAMQRPPVLPKVTR
jgi:hypothetical protein